MVQLNGNLQVFVHYWVESQGGSAAGGDIAQVVDVPSTMDFFAWNADGLGNTC